MHVRGLAVFLAVALGPGQAEAHPHEWIDVASEVLFDERGAIEAIRHHWRFDEAFTSFALQGLDTNRDGAYSAAELQPLAEENVQSLAEYDFFTFITTGDYQAGFAAPKDYRLEFDGERLTLQYTLPLAQPLFTKGDVLLQVYDPEYYIAYVLPSREAVRLVGAPAGCRLDVTPAQGPDPQSAAVLATVGPDQRVLPEEMQDLIAGIDNSATIRCGGPTVAAAGSQPGAAQSAREAAEIMASNGSSGGDLNALPGGLPAPETPPPGTAVRDSSDVSRPSRGRSGSPEDARGSQRWLAGLQIEFQRNLTEALKGLQTSNAAFWWLGGVSFLYGIIHAAGPGHGKFVISSYLLANEERVRRGVGIAFISAFVQAMVAVAIVGLMAIVLNMTGAAMTNAAQHLETGSFALVAALGLLLLFRKGRQVWAIARGGDAHAGHAHAQPRERRHHSAPGSRIQWDEPSAAGGHAHHGAGCGCSHHAAPETLSGSGMAAAAAAVLSVGLRPCSGALIVLVFALAQGIFWAGVASTFLMALGTAITVAVLAALAVGAKDIAARLAAGDGRRSGQVMLGLEVAAALLVTALGAALFLGSLQA